jgi:hypothetical protein
MTQYRIITKRFVSSDGKVIAEAKSIASASDTNNSQVNQSVAIHVDQNGAVSSKSVSISTCSKVD